MSTFAVVISDDLEIIEKGSLVEVLGWVALPPTSDFPNRLAAHAEVNQVLVHRLLRRALYAVVVRAGSFELIPADDLKPVAQDI